MGVCTGKAKKSYTYREKRKLRHCTKRRSIEQRNKKIIQREEKVKEPKGTDSAGHHENQRQR